MTQATTNPDHTPASQTQQDVQYNPLEHDNECFKGVLPLDMTSPKDTRIEERIVALHRLRTFIEAQPRTRSLFKLADVRDATGCKTRGINKEMLSLVGAWEVPDRFPGGAKQNYVNPRSTDAWMYSPVGTFCECGALVYSGEQGEQKTESLPVGRTGHSDECHVAMRARAIADVMEKRHEQIQIALEYDQSSARVGSKSKYIAWVAARHGFTKEEAYDRYRKRVAHTAAAWLHKYSAPELAEAFDIAKRTLLDLIREHVPVDSMAMYRYRQKMGITGQFRAYPFEDSDSHPPRRWFDNPQEVPFDD